MHIISIGIQVLRMLESYYPIYGSLFNCSRSQGVVLLVSLLHSHQVDWLRHDRLSNFNVISNVKDVERIVWSTGSSCGQEMPNVIRCHDNCDTVIGLLYQEYLEYQMLTAFQCKFHIFH